MRNRSGVPRHGTIYGIAAATAITLYGLPDPALAATINVGPGDSIQAAIDAAAAGDEIVVAPGTYLGAVDMRGKAVTLRSSDGPGSTVLDGMGFGTVVTCSSGEGADTVVQGFTITGGNSPLQGGGMLNMASSPTVRDCVFLGNNGFFGGGMHNESASPVVDRCRFLGNTAFFGAGMSNSNSTPVVSNSAFSGNLAQPFAGGEGGGMSNSFSDVVVINCTFANNQAGSGGGMHNGSSSPLVTNSIMWSNLGMLGPSEVAAVGSSVPVFAYCNIENFGGTGAWNGVGVDAFGNIDADPMFGNALGADGLAGTADDDLRLTAGSPSVDAGDSAAALGDGDLDGRDRRADRADTVDSGTGGAPVVDMGAYELMDPPPPPPPPPPVDDEPADDDGGDAGDDPDDGGPADDDDAGDDVGDVDETMVVGLDIKPRGRRNVTKAHKRLRMGVLGSDEFDPDTIDRTTLQLTRADGVGGAATPWKIRRSLRDVSGPHDVPIDTTERWRGRPDHRDGYGDLVVRFLGADVHAALELADVEVGTQMELVLSGRLLDGTPFEARDMVHVHRRRAKRNR